jgi:crotonobetainyl-CoA:carnitine CoA-transferase CaiB-like acyl-CoA transferase
MTLPLAGLKVLEFTHAVMGPCCGLLLADMGAEVIHIEAPQGDPTRRLQGFGTGYFQMYNRNKKSLSINLKAEAGKEIIYQLCRKADIVVENFGPGTMERLGLGPEKLRALNDRLIYCSLKGFLSGPYEQRPAMDEVVQMMGGLAYMTGRSGDPLRAGSSVIDIAGGMFGYMGILQALYERERTGQGKFVKAALFETCTFFMGQHMAYSSQVDFPVPPMPERANAWSIYRIFPTADEDSIFIGIISEKHWQRFCGIFGWEDWLANEQLSSNAKRLAARDWFMPELAARIARFSKAELIRRCEKAGIPFAPITRPEELFNDPQLKQGGSLLPTPMPNGETVALPATPLEYGDAKVEMRIPPPHIGEHNAELLRLIGYSELEIDRLKKKSIISNE